MNDKTIGGVHWSFWAIGAIALIWNVAGSVNFFAQMNAHTVASMPESYRAVIETRPAWGTGAFAIAVFSGALGCLLLLLRKAAAYYFFIGSLLGVIVQTVPNLGVAGSTNDFGPDLAGALMSLVVAAFLIWYSNRVKIKGWIS